MKIFKKKDKEKKKKVKEEVSQSPKIIEQDKTIKGGTRTLKDLLAVPVDKSNPDYIKVGNKYIKSFFIHGYPSTVRVGWLDHLYNYKKDADVSLYIEPSDERDAIEEISKKITQFQTQLRIEEEKGINKNITSLQKKLDDSIALRASMEQNSEKLFYTKIYTNLYCNDVDELEKESQTITNFMKSRNTEILPNFLQQDKSYLSCLPFGACYSNDPYRNFSAGALTSCFPFYNAEISHPNGVFIGLNKPSNTPVFIDPFNRDYLPNNNVSVFGMSGSGKTFLTSLLTMRLALNGVNTVIIDPESEYIAMTKQIGGTVINLGANSPTRINPFDIEEEEDTLANGTVVKSVNLNEKVADITNLIGVMVKDLSREQESLLAISIRELYEKFGINDNPDSLYTNEKSYDENTGQFFYKGERKTMPTLTDLWNLIAEKTQDPDYQVLIPILNALKMFKKGEVYGIFDDQTNVDINFKNSPVITFDVGNLEEGTLRPIGMYQCLSWVWEKFVKKNPDQRKMVLVDEAWQLVSSALPGSQYTAAFLDKASRRIRKRNAGLIIASQSFNEFRDSSLGRAVLTNTSLNILLKQKQVDIDAVKDVFALSDGESQALLTARVGEAIIKIGQESAKIESIAFRYEYDLIVPEHLKK